jgi:hypothetical protein
MRPVGLRAILCRRLTQLPALKGLRAGSDRVPFGARARADASPCQTSRPIRRDGTPFIGEKSCSKRLNGGSKGQKKG